MEESVELYLKYLLHQIDVLKSFTYIKRLTSYSVFLFFLLNIIFIYINLFLYESALV